MMGVFALTVFTSAALLFVVQPMVGELILPHLGGSSSVWTTCMLFFQSVLVVGYGYAHYLSKHVPPLRQAWVHLAVVGAAILSSLPLEVPEELLNTTSSPALSVLLALVVGIGLPVFVVSTSAPLFQRWYSYTDHPDADDPYYLYAASNVGSMIALLGYPFVLEPLIGLDEQRWAWSAGFLTLGVLTAVCGWYLARRRLPAASAPEEEEEEADAPAAPPLSWPRRLRWIGWAFIPSSLMLGVTEYMTTDIASVPLLWVVPLALYLLTFILVFARRPIRLPRQAQTGLPVMVMAVLGATRADFIPMVWLLVLHLVMFFLVALFFHGRMAADRPHKTRLTEFFIWMSVGGAAGGLFNSLIAPALFDRPVEYTFVLAAAVAAIPPDAQRTEDEFTPRWVIPVMLAISGFMYLRVVGFWTLKEPFALAGSALVCAAAFVLAWRMPRLENIACAAMVAVGLHAFFHLPDVIDYDRSFYASYAVIERELDDGSYYRKLSHGTTAHGLQWASEEREDEPLAYHHPSGPVGQVLDEIPAERVGVLGLGAGAMAAYGGPDRPIDFFEIDPIIEEVAREDFTYLDQCGRHCDVQIGDGRRLLEEAEDDRYDLLFLDAYSSDSVPTHLLTREALDTYFDKVDEDGVLVFNVSNRYLNIESIVGALAEDAGYEARTQLHRSPSDRPLVYTSAYTVVARSEDHLEGLADGSNWEETERADVVWTDDFTNIVRVLK